MRYYITLLYFCYFDCVLGLSLQGTDLSQCKFTNNVFKTDGGLDWSYDALNSWDDICKGGQMQSPVDLPRTDMVFKDMGEISFQNYASSPFAQRITNTGHSVMIDVCDTPNRMPRISGGELNDTYIFHQLHFHWSDSDSLGSEHTKSGTHFPLEVQLVHYKESLGSFEYALNDPEGLAILSVFFQLHVERNAKWDHFLPLVKNVTKAGTEVILNAPFPLSYLLPSNTKDFYRYKGSLTAPPCTENVVWTIFRMPVPILLKQLDNFRKVYGPADQSSRFLEADLILQNSRAIVENSATREVFTNAVSKSSKLRMMVERFIICFIFIFLIMHYIILDNILPLIVH